MNQPLKRIYFMRQVGGIGPIKIGCSCWPDDRLLTIALWSPVPLELLCSARGDHKLERAVHRYLAKSLSHREWFFPAPEVISLIDSVIAGVSIEEAIGYSQRIVRRRDRKFGMRPASLCTAVAS